MSRAPPWYRPYAELKCYMAQLSRIAPNKIHSRGSHHDRGIAYCLTVAYPFISNNQYSSTDNNTDHTELGDNNIEYNHSADGDSDINGPQPRVLWSGLQTTNGVSNCLLPAKSETAWGFQQCSSNYRIIISGNHWSDLFPALPTVMEESSVLLKYYPPFRERSGLGTIWIAAGGGLWRGYWT